MDRLSPEQIADGWKLTERPDGSGTLLYTLKADGYRKGKEVFANDQTILIEGAGHRELAQLVLAALSPDLPTDHQEAVAWRMYDKQSAEIWGKPTWNFATKPDDLPPESIRHHWHVQPLFTRPTVRLEWRNNHLFLNDVEIGVVSEIYAQDGPKAPITDTKYVVHGIFAHSLRDALYDTPEAARAALMARAREWLGV